MSTRGAMGFYVEGQDKITFNHWSSHPKNAGLAILEACRKVIKLNPAGWLDRTAKAIVLGGGGISYDDFAEIIENGGGTYPDDFSFLYDSLYCEWAYIINIDSQMFEVYSGFNSNPKAPGRYATTPTPKDYAGVKLIKEYPLNKLPTTKEFIRDMDDLRKEEV